MKIEPIEMMRIETPSTFHLNFSPMIIGDKTAVEIIDTHMVDDVRITLPNENETIFNN